MVASTHNFAEPPCPLPPELRSDIAYRRAQGSGWDAIGATTNYNSNAIRRACENDPDFAAAQAKAWAEVTWEGEADAMVRLRQMARGCDDDRALEAAEILVKYARERRRDDTRLAVERLRTEASLARTEAKARAAQEADEGPRFSDEMEERLARIRQGAAAERERNRTETPEQRAERLNRETTEEAAAPTGASGEKVSVYLWGGKHSIGRSVEPDESDTLVRIERDWSCGVLNHGVLYWVVPAQATASALRPGKVSDD